MILKIERICGTDAALLRLCLQGCAAERRMLGSDGKYFLLEDDRILSKGISIALKKDEHTVTAVYHYTEALQKYHSQRYDLFLLDINLPGGSGLELCKKSVKHRKPLYYF